MWLVYVTFSALQSRSPQSNSDIQGWAPKSQYFQESSVKLLASLQTFAF